MMKSQTVLTLLASLACCACVSSSSYVYSGSTSEGTHLIDEVVTEEGETRSYVLHCDSDGAPTMNLTVSRTGEIAVVGVRTRSIDRALASGLGVEPWSGILLDEVVEGSAASAAGLRQGDVLIEVDDKAVTHSDQFRDFVATELTPHAETTAVISRIVDSGVREQLTLPITLGSREVETSTTDTVDLGSSPELAARTGMQLATVDAELARQIWNESSPRVYVCSVVLGSPAYLSGVRKGDRLLSFDQEDVHSAQQVTELIQGGPAKYEFVVSAGESTHEGVVETVESLNTKSNFYFPILLDYSSRPHRTKVSFLDFIFQFGFNYDGWYAESDSRQPAKKSNLSILPLGMFEFERSPTKSKNTIFWLISWSTRR